jgi:hypothetical protein
MMEATRTSETSVDIPEDSELRNSLLIVQSTVRIFTKYDIGKIYKNLPTQSSFGYNETTKTRFRAPNLLLRNLKPGPCHGSSG